MMKRKILQIIFFIPIGVILLLLAFIITREGKHRQEINEKVSQERIKWEQQLIETRSYYEDILKQQREAMELQSNREAAYIMEEARVDQTVKNITQFLTVSVGFKDKIIGGVEQVSVTVKNTSEFKMEQVTVKLSYMKKGAPYDTRLVTLYEVKPHSSMTISAPDGTSGNSVTGIIYKVRSAELGHP